MSRGTGSARTICAAARGDGASPATPWQMTPDTFAAAPSTWWHGTRYGELREQADAQTSGQGFHVGSYEAARAAVAAQTGWDPGPRGRVDERQQLAYAFLAKWAGDPQPDESGRPARLPGPIRFVRELGPHSRVGTTSITVRFDGLWVDVLDATQEKDGPNNLSWAYGAARKAWFGLRRDGVVLAEPGDPREGPRVYRETGKLSGAAPDTHPDEQERPTMIPIWITGPMANTPNEDVWKDEDANETMARALRTGEAREGMYYTNISEDSGSVSAVMPDRSFVMTHREFVADALARGESVPANVRAHYA